MNDYEIAKIYEEMEKELIASLKRNLGRHKKEEKKVGFEFTQWQSEKLKELKRYQRQNKAIINGYTKGLDKQVAKMMQNELLQGKKDAFKNYKQALKEGYKSSKTVKDSFFRINDRKVDALIKVVNNDLDKASHAALRMINDDYRQTIHKAEMYVANGVYTQKQAVDMAIKEFESKGINCIQYANGARHTISNYTKMAIRTANTRVHLMGEGEFRKKIGETLIIMSKHGTACELCQPFEGKVLIDDVYSGGTKKDGNYMLLSEAMKQGLYHPNCRHGHGTYYKQLGKKTSLEIIEKVEPEGPKFTPATSKAEAIKFAESNFGIKTFYDNLNLNVANEINQSLFENYNRYPELKKQIKQVGSLQQRNKKMHWQVFQTELAVLEKYNPGASYRALSQAAKTRTHRILKRAAGQYASAIDYSDPYKYLNGIVFNDKYGATYTPFLNAVKKDVSTGYHPIGTDSIKAVMDHEIGHNLDYLLGARHNDKMIAIWKKYALTTKNELSEYATTNIAEFIAEGYAEYINNPKPRQIAKEIGKLLDELYKEKFK